MLDHLMRWFGSAGARTRATVSGIAPQSPQAADAVENYYCGVAHYQRGDWEPAKEAFRQALERQHDLAEAHFYLGLIARAQANCEDASDCLLLATAFKPDFAEAWFYLGIVALDRQRYDEAASNFSAALRIKPDYAEVYNVLGTMCSQRKQFRDATVHFRKALELNPRFAPAYSNLAHVTLRELFDADAALGYAQKALELDPQLAGAHNNLAMVLQFQGRCEEALEASARALELNPSAVETLLIRAYAQLTLGRFDEGWRDYESRKRILPTFNVRKFPYPEWDGSQPANRRMLVYHEQGLGDEIMFASCFPDLLALGAQAVIECSQKLERLFRRSFPLAAIQVADQASPDMSYLQTLPGFDFQVAAGSLPLFFRRSWSDFPLHRGYLTADPERIAYWRGRLQALGPTRKIGLSWRGGRNHTNQARRSLNLDQFLPLLQLPQTTFISLQYDDCHDDLAQLSERHGVVVHHWHEAIDDYDETAALVAALDLVVSVQTAAVLLAGALGKAVWIMVSSIPEWPYMARGERMPWYPAARIFRQAPGEGWQRVVAAMRDEMTLWSGIPLSSMGPLSPGN